MVTISIVFFSILLLIVLLILVSNIKIVPQATEFVVERLGAYYATWETGLHFKTPFLEIGRAHV